MKPEFSEILLPHSKLQPESCSSSLHAQVVTNSVNTKVIKWLLGIAILFTIIMAIVTTAFIFRYEDKMAQYEERIFSFETELEAIFNKLAEEHGAFEDEELVFGTHPHEASSFDQSDEESDSEGEHFGVSDYFILSFLFSTIITNKELERSETWFISSRF